MYEDEYYYEARKKENAKLDAELAGTFATVIGGLIGAVLSCLIFLLRRFDVLSSGLASLLFYMLRQMRHETRKRSVICFSFAKEYGSRMKRQLITGSVMGMALF